jgi:predicted metal-dependent phosphoesterase TrpH
MDGWAIDLHIHTALSPCAEREMSPGNVIARAKDLEIDVLAVTDHNTCGNVRVFMEKGEEVGVLALPGMELETKEAIHVVCLFDNLEAALDFDRLIQTLLPSIPNNIKALGNQFLLDKDGAVIGEDPRMLLVGANISIEDAVEEVKARGGLAVAAHIDRQAYSLVSVFGFVPNNLGLHGVELTARLKRNEAMIAQAEELGYQLISASDAHTLDQMEEPHCYAILDRWSLGELKQALRGQEGRSIMRMR